MEQQQHLIEQHQTNQNQDKHISCLRCIPTIMIVFGLILMFTGNGSGASQSSSGPSLAMISLAEKLPYIAVGMSAVTGLVFMVLAFVTRTESKRINGFFLIFGLILIAVALLQFIMIPPQPQIIPVSH